MNKSVRSGLAVLATGLLVTMVGYGTATASDWGSEGGSIEGQGTSFGSFDFHGSNDSDDPFDAEGYFTGVSPFGPAVKLQGPITCLDIQGNQAGFIYKIDDPSSPPIFNGHEVKVSIEDGENGGADKISFGIAEPAGFNKSCAPEAATSDVKDGNIEVHDNGDHDNGDQDD